MLALSTRMLKDVCSMIGVVIFFSYSLVTAEAPYYPRKLTFGQVIEIIQWLLLPVIGKSITCTVTQLSLNFLYFQIKRLILNQSKKLHKWMGQGKTSEMSTRYPLKRKKNHKIVKISKTQATNSICQTFSRKQLEKNRCIKARITIRFSFFSKYQTLNLQIIFVKCLT